MNRRCRFLANNNISTDLIGFLLAVQFLVAVWPCVQAASAVHNSKPSIHNKQHSSSATSTLLPADFYDKHKHQHHQSSSIESALYDHLVAHVKFSIDGGGGGGESCQLVFQNCLMNVDNDQSIEQHSQVAVDHECFPFEKARSCLHADQYRDSEYCSYHRIKKRAHHYLQLLLNDAAVCSARFPPKRLVSQPHSSGIRRLGLGRSSHHHRFVMASSSFILALLLRFNLN